MALSEIAIAAETYLTSRTLTPLLSSSSDLDVAIRCAESSFLALVVRGHEAQTAAAAGALLALSLVRAENLQPVGEPAPLAPVPEVTANALRKASIGELSFYLGAAIRKLDRRAELAKLGRAYQLARKRVHGQNEMFIAPSTPVEIALEEILSIWNTNGRLPTGELNPLYDLLDDHALRPPAAPG